MSPENVFLTKLMIFTIQSFLICGVIAFIVIIYNFPELMRRLKSIEEALNKKTNHLTED